MSALATSLQAWFTDRLIRERNASPHTIASYRDTIRLLLTYASGTLGVEPSRLDLDQLDARLVGAFLDHLETERGCSPRTRNTRLAAIRTFYRYCVLRHPEHAATLAGREVTVIMDCDERGRTAAAAIESDLSSLGAVRVLDLAPDRDDGYDLTDWLRQRERSVALGIHEVIATTGDTGYGRR